MKRNTIFKYYNFVFLLIAIYWVFALYGKYKHNEIFPFFHWGLYASIPSDNISYYLKIVEIEGKEQDISFYDYNYGKLGFRILEKNLREYTNNQTEQNTNRLKAFLPNCSVSEIFTITNKKNKTTVGYIVNE